MARLCPATACSRDGRKAVDDGHAAPPDGERRMPYKTNRRRHSLWTRRIVMPMKVGIQAFCLNRHRHGGGRVDGKAVSARPGRDGEAAGASLPWSFRFNTVI
jgi:hypothetical protein